MASNHSRASLPAFWEGWLLFRIRKSFPFAGRLGGKFLGERVVVALLVPQDAHNPPSAAIVKQLNAVDPASKRSFAGSASGFVAAEDLGDVSEGLDAIHDGTFIKSMFCEVTAGPPGVILDAHGTDANGTIRVLGGRSEASQRQEQRAEAIPVALASGAGNHAVERHENTVDGLHVLGARSGNARRRTGRGLRGRLLLGRRLCRGRLSRSGKGKRKDGGQGQKSASHWVPPLRQRTIIAQGDYIPGSPASRPQAKRKAAALAPTGPARLAGLPNRLELAAEVRYEPEKERKRDA